MMSHKEHESLDTSPVMFTVLPEAADQPLADLVVAQVGAIAAAPLLARGGVWLDRWRVTDPAAPASVGAQVTLHRPPGGRYSEVTIAASDICYEDPWLIALNKRSGWYTSATPWDTQGNVLAALERFLQARDGAAPRLHLAHRLDRDTSGVLLCTKDPRANAPLQQVFAAGAVEKVYICVCADPPAAPQFEVRTGHGRGRSGLWRLYELDEVGTVLLNGSRVRLAHTSFTLVKQWDDASLLHAFPHTGRTHQIRLHLASLGLPLLGDQRYGGVEVFRGQELAGHLLHAARLGMRHPITHRPLELQAALPEHIAAVVHSVD